MLFSSTTFMFLFLPVILGLYYICGEKFRNTVILIASLFFYAWGENVLVIIMIISIIINNYICGIIIDNNHHRDKSLNIDGQTKRKSSQKAALIISVVSSLSILAFYKYFNFCIDNYNIFIGMIGLTDLQLTNVSKIALPLGISFYIFQTLSYTIDVYRGYVKATRNLLNFACFVAMFPQLVAGPILRYKDMAKQLTKRIITIDGFAEGVRRFIIGLGKKMIIANLLAIKVDKIFATPAHNLTFLVSWLGIICYTLQIYFDFSGYSDMAIGLGRMFGFKFMENFNYP